MIGIFRNIRRQLAGENRILDYSRYALGEIVLVMIGILLALQVNNWNEKRKQNVQRDTYLKALLIDLKENAEYLQKRNGFVEKEIEIQGTFEGRLEHPLASIDTIVKIATEEISLLYYFFSPLNKSTYETLLNTGHIEYFEPWLVEYLQQLNFLHSNLMGINESLGSDYSLVLKDFLSVYPKNTAGKIITDQLAFAVTNEIPLGQKISALNSLMWIKGGAYYSLLRRSQPLEEQTKRLIDTLTKEYPFLKHRD